MRICKDCGIEKPLSEFYRNGINKETGKVWCSRRCAKCHNLKFRPATGVISSTRFKKGHIPWSKKEDGRHSLVHKEWIKNVFERDEYVCQKCLSNENLNAHHIKSWKNYPELRFNLDNGITLCSTCHGKIHVKTKPCFRKGNIPWNKGTVGVMVAWNKGVKATPEARAKMCGPRKGFVPWNKGLKGAIAVSDDTRKKQGESLRKYYAKNDVWNKGLKSTEETKKRISLGLNKHYAKEKLKRKEN